MSLKNSYDKSSPRKRKHEESQSPTREAGEIRNCDNSRHDSISSYKSIKPKYFNNGKYKFYSKEQKQSDTDISIEKCISKLIGKEIERSKNDKVQEKNEMRRDVRKLKDSCSELFEQLDLIKSKLKEFQNALKNNNNNNNQYKISNEIDELYNKKIEKIQINLKSELITEITNIFDEKIAAAVEAALKEQNEKIENIQNSIDEISEKVDQFEQQLEEDRHSVQYSNENTIFSVMEEKLTEKQKELSLKDKFKSPISCFTEPKWLVPEQKCNELYKFCQGKVTKFLNEYLPLLYDLPEIIAPLKRDAKKEEAEKVLSHFWKGSISMKLITKEIEKEHAAQRYKTSRKIYLGLKNFDGVIMSNKGAIYECCWDSERRQYLQKSENVDDSNSSAMEWQLPKELQKLTYEKGKDYIIVAKNDDSNQIKICKIDLFDFEIDLLYTKRKYGNT